MHLQLIMLFPTNEHVESMEGCSKAFQKITVWNILTKVLGKRQRRSSIRKAAGFKRNMQSIWANPWLESFLVISNLMILSNYQSTLICVLNVTNLGKSFCFPLLLFDASFLSSSLSDDLQQCQEVKKPFLSLCFIPSDWNSTNKCRMPASIGNCNH